MHWIWATATSLGFPNLAIKIDFALAYPSDVKGRPSIRALTLGTKKSFREEKLLIALILIFQFLFRIDPKIETKPDVYPQILLSQA